ncbi:MAG TPA: DUF2786 domain-containing protein [Acidimicrobiales bacterium]|nr:DUF2786 domain-containing protein [Acidimicrobiales bacterium]
MSESNWEQRADLRSLLAVAANAQGRLSPPIWEALRNAAVSRGTGGTALVIDELMCDVLHSVWEGGWQPGEVVRLVRRRRGQDHADLIRTAIAASHSLIPEPPPPAWAGQLAELDADRPWWGNGRDWLGPWSLRRGLPFWVAFRMAVEALGAVMRLPPLEPVVPPPSKWGSLRSNGPTAGHHIDESVLAKVRALLAKAESTNFEHESDALTAKAQELMARHAIDEALAGETPGRAGASREVPSLRRVPVDDPDASAKSNLLAVVASANNVRAVWHVDFALMTLIGFEADLDTVEVLFTSLLMQASRAMLAQGRILDERGRSRTRSFRQSFIVAFAQRIHERLVAAARQARVTAEEELGRDLLPVLAGRKDEVDDYTSRLFPHLARARRHSVTNEDGWRAGRAAAERATLGPERKRLDSL